MQEESQAAGRYEQRPCPHDSTAGHLVPTPQTTQPRQAAVHQGQSLHTVSRRALHPSSVLGTLWTSEKSRRNLTVLEPRDRILSQETFNKIQKLLELEGPT